MRRMFTVLIGLSALFVAGCAAVFSVRGLGLLFAGSAVAVMTMAASLELGKLVAASFLYRFWNHTSLPLKTYLTLAVGVLMGITSLGIYGYLARAYETTQTKVALLQHQVDTLQAQIDDTQHQITSAQGQSTQLHQADQLSIQQQQQRITDADRVFADSLKRLQDQRQSARDGYTKDLALTQQQLAQADDVFKTSSAQQQQAIDSLNARLAVLDNAVETYTKQGGGIRLLPDFINGDGVRKGQDLREQQKPERTQIAQQLADHDAALTRLRTDHDAAVKTVNARTESRQKDYDAQIARLDDQEKQLRTAHAKSVADAQTALTALRAGGRSTQQAGSNQVESLYQRIRTNQDQIGALRDQIAHTDVGTYSFVARALGIPVDHVVRWLILIIVVVFDPLAVTLTIGFNVALLKGVPKRASTLGIAPGTAATADAAHDPAPARRFGWIGPAVTGLLLLVLVGAGGFALVHHFRGTLARSHASLIPPDSFAVLTLSPSAGPEALEHQAAPLLSGLVPPSLTQHLGSLLQQGLDPAAPVYFFTEFPHAPGTAVSGGVSNPSRMVLLVGMVAAVRDPAAAEAALWKFTQQVASPLMPRTAVAPGAVRSMIQFGRGRYLDPDGGFFTFGLTRHAAIVLLELDGDPQHPVVELAMRQALTDHTDAPGDADPLATGSLSLPARATATDAAVSLWFDGDRCFSQMPKNAAAQARYEHLRPYLAFDADLALRTAPGELRITGDYNYAVKRFDTPGAPGPGVPGPLTALRTLGTDTASGTAGVLMDRCVQTLDFDSLIARLRTLLAQPRDQGPAAPVVVNHTVESDRRAVFNLRAQFDPKTTTPVARLMD